ncbi:MAG: hypothetical protein D4S01_00975 [Dehalococcoidia bacterium]|nr:MAG: hypothetical protein D4S01_00975 [Dehalococcoidia bacterium]
MEKENVKYFGFIFWLHLVVVMFAYLSPFLFNWKAIILSVIILFVQYSLVGGCFLNKIQFGNAEDVVFLYPYLTMLGLKLNPDKLKIFIRYILPFVLLFIAIIWQVVLHKVPVVF